LVGSASPSSSSGAAAGQGRSLPRAGRGGAFHEQNPWQQQEEMRPREEIGRRRGWKLLVLDRNKKIRKKVYVTLLQVNQRPKIKGSLPAHRYSKINE
jgi:hypothetical protein